MEAHENLWGPRNCEPREILGVKTRLIEKLELTFKARHEGGTAKHGRFWSETAFFSPLVRNNFWILRKLVYQISP